MSADYFFRMGATHTICQDYALAGSKDGVQYAILSDGCSGAPIPNEPGSPYTDWGARLLARSAQKHIGSFADGFHPVEEILTDAAAALRLLSLPDVALDATLSVAVFGGEYVRVFESGDGVLAVRDRNGTLYYRTREFDNGMPYYLSYRLNKYREQQFHEKSKFVLNTRGTCHTGSSLGPSWTSVTNESHVAQDHYDHYQSIFHRSREEVVLLFSDGVKSFHDAEGKPVPLEDVLEQMLALKNFHGQFIGRRCHKFLDKFCAERGWRHADDFSVAGIYLGEAT